MQDHSPNSAGDLYDPLPPHCLINAAQTFGALRNAEERIMQYGGTTVNVMRSINLKRKRDSPEHELTDDQYIWGHSDYVYSRTIPPSDILGQMCNNISFEEAEMVRRCVIAYYRNWEK